MPHSLQYKRNFDFLSWVHGEQEQKAKMNKATLLSVILESPCFFPLSNHFIAVVDKAKKALALELKLYQKLIFKNTNTHKKTKYWQRVRQVKGWIQALQLTLEYFSLDEPHHDSTPKSSVLFLHKLFGFYSLCTEVSLFAHCPLTPQTINFLKAVYGYNYSLFLSDLLVTWLLCLNKLSTCLLLWAS